VIRWLNLFQKRRHLNASPLLRDYATRHPVIQYYSIPATPAKSDYIKNSVTAQYLTPLKGMDMCAFPSTPPPVSWWEIIHADVQLATFVAAFGSDVPSHITQMSGKGRLRRFGNGPTIDPLRRIFPVTARSSEGLFTEPTAGAQP
jgi:hypothetical protein